MSLGWRKYEKKLTFSQWLHFGWKTKYCFKSINSIKSQSCLEVILRKRTWNNYCYWWFQNWSGQHKSIKRIHGTSNRRGNSFGNIKWWLFKKFQRCKKKENIASWKFLFFQTSCLSPFFLLTQNLHHIEIPPVKSHANLFLTNLHGLRSAVSGIFKLSTSLTESKCFIIYSI